MSLIQCPKCGGPVSDTAGECVHCGFAFKICPDCGAVLAKDAEKCEHCGFVFQETGAVPEASTEVPHEASSAQDTPKSYKPRDYIKEWENSGEQASWLKRSRKFSVFIELADLFILLVSFFLVFGLKGADPLKQVSEFHHYQLASKILWVISVSVSVITLTCADEIRETCLIDSFVKWVKKENINLLQHVTDSYDKYVEVTEKEALDFQHEMVCAYVTGSRKGSVLRLFSVTFSGILSVAIIVLLSLWGSWEFFPQYYNYILFQIDAWGSLNYILLIVAGSLIVLEVIFSLGMKWLVFRRAGKFIEHEIVKRK